MTRRRLGYGSAWQDYAAAGWTPTPLDRGEKFPPQPDVTGNRPTRYDPTSRDFKRWAREYPDGNIMITMPANVIGIDVDAYHGGLTTMAGLVREYGDLPTTWESSSRDDGSGIGLYRVPNGTRLVGKIDPGIEIIQYHHRYAVVWPSIHPEGRVYRWWIGDTSAGIPRVQWDLPYLPDRWLKALADRPKATSKDGTPYSGDVGDWLAELPDRRTPASVRKIVRDAERAFGAGACRHDTMVQATGALVALGARGRPVYDALHELGNLFCDAVAGDRDSDEEYEYWSAVEGAVKQWGGRKPRRQWPTAPWVTEAVAR